MVLLRVRRGERRNSRSLPRAVSLPRPDDQRKPEALVLGGDLAGGSAHSDVRFLNQSVD